MPSIERSINRWTYPSASTPFPASASLGAPPKSGGAEPETWWRDLPPQPEPGLLAQQGSLAFELDGVGMQASGTGSGVGDLLFWRERSGAISNIVGGADEDRERLLALIAGKVRPSVGRRRIAGHELEALPPAAQRALRHRFVGSVLPGDALFPQLTLRENVALPLLAGAVPDALALKEAQVELEQLGLGNVGDVPPALLRASQRRSALIAIALVHGPRLCVIDHPEESLGEREIGRLRQRLSQAARVDGMCLVLSTKHPQLTSLVGTTLSLAKHHALPVRT